MLVVVVGVQLAHVAMLLAGETDSAQPVASNLLQLLVPVMTAAICLYRSRAGQRAREDRRLEPWPLLTCAFGLWAVAQSLFLAGVLVPGALPSWPPHALWLAFPFPLMLAASRLPETSRHDAVRGLDIAQASLFFSTLSVMAFLKPAIISLSLVYMVQSVALVLACGLRYSMSAVDREREFYRRLAWFAGFYAVFSILGSLGQMRGFRSGTAIDICWTLPFSLFSIVALRPDRAGSPAQSAKAGRAHPTHLHGIIAHCLTAMSFAAAMVLAWYHPLPGGLTLLCAFLLSAARTSLRDWQMQAFHMQLEHSALHDAATGLPNRIALQLELANRLERREPASAPLGVLFVDLDRFHLVNDGLGYDFGNLLINKVADLLKAQLGPRDVLARSGGDEFLLLLDGVTAEGAQHFAERILAGLRRPLEVDGRLLSLTASAGLALSGEGSQADTLLQSANCAMYNAKRLGRDRLQTFMPEMLTKSRGRHKLYTQLRTAIDEQRIEVHYQPIYSLRKETIVGFEALARWHEPEHGFIPPSEFVPLAEETGLIVELGRQVLELACAQCAAWNRCYGTALAVSVNVSAHQFAQAGLRANVIAALEKADLSPAHLKLEITESVLLSGFVDAEALVQELRSIGIGLSLDDFGTGYSSLSYMLNLPFDILKIDRSFVHSFDTDRRRAQMVESIINLAGKLDMRIVAEGVETAEELARLREHDCDMVQGFYVSRPLEPTAIEEMLGSDLCSSAVGCADSPLLRRFVRSTSTSSLARLGEPVVRPAQLWQSGAVLPGPSRTGGRW